MQKEPLMPGKSGIRLLAALAVIETVCLAACYGVPLKESAASTLMLTGLITAVSAAFMMAVLLAAVLLAMLVKCMAVLIKTRSLKQAEQEAERLLIGVLTPQPENDSENNENNN